MTSPKPTSTVPTSTDNTTPAPAEPTVASSQTTSVPVKTKKTGSKVKPRRPRRRGVSDSESEHDAASGSESSSNASASDHSDSEDENEVDPPSASKAKDEPTTTFADADSTTPAAWKPSDPSAPVEELTFDAFNRGEAGTVTRGSTAKRGRGGKTSETGRPEGEKEKKVYTEEQTRKFEERKAKMKERQKEKKKERAAAKKKEGEEKQVGEGDVGEGKSDQPEASSSKKPLEKKEPAKKSKVKAKARQPSVTEDDVAAAIAELDIDDPPAQASTSVDIDKESTSQQASASTPVHPPNGPRGLANRISRDPRVTPRAGGFWTHDQRQSDHGHFNDGGFGGRGSRGRVEPFRGARGGFRGRGRGGFNAVDRGNWDDFGGGRGQELTTPVEKVELLPDGEKTLEMDKLEAELDRKRAAAQEQARAEAESLALAVAQAQAEPEQQVAEDVVVKTEESPAQPPRTVKEPKWGHEGFESMQAVQQFQANRLNIRGRGRGRVFFGGRGGFANRQPLHNLPTPQHTPNGLGSKLPPVNASAPIRPSPLNVNNPVTPTEESSTQPTSDSLLDSDAVKVKIPGAGEIASAADPANSSTEKVASYSTVSRPSSSAQTFLPASSTIRASAPAFVAPRARPAQPSPIPFNSHVFSDGTASPQPFLATGSENGSISSNGHFVPPYNSQGAGVGPNGEYYPIANGSQGAAYRSQVPPQQRPSFSQRQFPPQPPAFYPQSYSPDPYQQHPSRHGSFGSQGGFIPDGRASPFPVYNNGTVFFAPPRPAKVQIKSPNSQDQPTEEAGLQRYPSIDQSLQQQQQPQQAVGLVEGPGGAYYAQHYNPYAGGNMGYMPNGMNGVQGGWNGAGGMGYVNDGYDYGY